MSACLDAYAGMLLNVQKQASIRSVRLGPLGPQPLFVLVDATVALYLLRQTETSMRRLLSIRR